MPQDFSYQNLRGRSFKGQNLKGADFSSTDIRGTNFAGANLIGANFKDAFSGLEKRGVIVLVSISWLLAGTSGFFSAIIGYLISRIIDSRSSEYQLIGWVSLIVITSLIAIVIHQGINTAFVLVFIIAFVGSVAGAFAVFVAFIGNEIFARAIVVAFATVIAFAIAVVITGTGAIAFVETGNGAFAFAITVAFASAFMGTGAFIIAVAVVTTFIFFLLSIYIARQAMNGSEKYALVRSIAIAVASFSGTSFKGANLSDANFHGAILAHTDFRGANLTRTCFQKTKKLDRVRPGTTYLKEFKVRQVILTLTGQDLNFDRQDLRGVNFQGAYLQDASFIGADLSNANLQDTDLSRAKLVQTQLDGTDFTGATLTGAYIEDWNITSSTNFTGVRCEYVYMRLPTTDNPDPYRKPDNREEVFGDGEFGDFIQPIFDTLDLYHSQGVDPRAIAISFKQLAENHPDAELEIVAMEKRGDNKFLLRAKTAPQVDKSVLSAEYFDTYNHLKTLTSEEQIKYYITELKIKDNQINSQKDEILRYVTMISTALGRPSIQAETYNNQGDTMSETFNNNNQGANIANFANQVKDSARQQANQYNIGEKPNLAQAASEIQQLLQQLQLDNPTSTDTERAIVAAKAADAIKSNPTLKARVIGALKSGGKEVLKEAVDNPIFNVSVAMIEGWQEAQ